MLDDPRLPTRLLILGVALFAFGLGCHFWADRVYRVAGLAIGAVQMDRYFLMGRISENEEHENRRLRACDQVTAVLIVMAILHTMTTVAM